MGMDDLLRSDIFHDGNMHLFLEAVRDIGFRIGEILAHLGETEIVLEMQFDVVGDLGDDGKFPVAVDGLLGVIKKGKQFPELGHRHDIHILISHLVVVVVQGLEETDFLGCQMEEGRLGMEFDPDRLGKETLGEFQNIAFIENRFVDFGEMEFSRLNENAVSGTELS